MWHPFKKPSIQGSRGEDLPEANTGNPDSSRPQGLCPRCEKQSSFEILGALPISFTQIMLAGERGFEPQLDALDQVSVLRCRNCGQGVAVVEEKRIGDKPHAEGTSGTVWFKGIFWWPLPHSRLPTEVPETVRAAYAEAARTLAADCPRASIVMSRRCLEAVVVDKGKTTGTLNERLAALAAANVLHPTLAEWAKEVRLSGNLGAHFDPLTSVSRDDAARLLIFVRELLRFLYELPAELQRARDARNPAAP
jgi:hypothetical protein